MIEERKDREIRKELEKFEASWKGTFGGPRDQGLNWMAKTHP
jgi:hypothetical protein